MERRTIAVAESAKQYDELEERLLKEFRMIRRDMRQDFVEFAGLWSGRFPVEVEMDANRAQLRLVHNR